MPLKNWNKYVRKQEEIVACDCLLNWECLDSDWEVKIKVDWILENPDILEKIKLIKEEMNLKLLNFNLNSFNWTDLLNLWTTLVENWKIIEWFWYSLYEDTQDNIEEKHIKQWKVEFLLKSIFFKKIDEFPYVEHPDLEFFTCDYLRTINEKEKLEELLNDAKELVYELACSIFDTNCEVLVEAWNELKNLWYKIDFVNHLVNRV